MIKKSHENNDTLIESLNFIVNLFYKKKQYISITIIFLLIFLITIVNYIPQKIEFRTEVKSISKFENEKYKIINLINDKDNKVFFNIDSSYLKSLFLEIYLRDFDFFKSILLSQNIFKKSDFHSEEEYWNAYRNEFNKLRVWNPVVTNEEISIFQRRYQAEFEISYTTNALTSNQIRKVAHLFLDGINEKVRQVVIKQFDEKSERYLIASKNQLQKIEAELELMEKNYDLLLELKLLKLKEAAEIARAIDLKSNTKYLISDASTITAVAKELPLYFRGYQALEKEIALKEKQSRDGLKIIEGSLGLINDADRIRYDQSVKRAKSEFKNLPLFKNDFKSVQYDILNENFEKLSLTYFSISILFITFSIIASVLWIIPFGKIFAVRKDN